MLNTPLSWRDLARAAIGAIIVFGVMLAVLAIAFAVRVAIRPAHAALEAPVTITQAETIADGSGVICVIPCSSADGPALCIVPCDIEPPETPTGPP